MTAPTDALLALLDVIVDRVVQRLRDEANQVPSRLVHVRDTVLPYREILRLIKCKELRVFGSGGRHFVDSAELETWILSHPINETGAADEIESIVAANRQRKAKRAKVAK